MSFVHPGFLWFLSLLAIPIILHLFHFRRFKRFYFPSLKFLKEQEQEKKSVKRLKRILILCARILAFISLIFAFAQPFFKKIDKPTNGIPVTAIYIDNSLSMSAKGTEGELLSESREIAKKIIAKSPGNTRFLLTTNSFSGVERKMYSKATAIQFIDAILYNKTPRALGQVIHWQDEYLARYHREITPISSLHRVLLSDFQKSTASLEDIKKHQSLIDEKTVLIQCIPQREENLYIDSVWMETPVHKPGQQCKLYIRVRNTGQSEQLNVPVTVNFDGKTRMTNVDVKGKTFTDTYLFFTPSSTGNLEGKVSVDDRNITFDDDFYFVNTVANQGSILIINGENGNSSTTKVFKTEPFYSIEECSEFSFSKRLLDSKDLVVLNGLNEFPSGLSTEIEAFVNQGGSVFCIPGNQINFSDYGTFLKGFGLSGFNRPTSSGNQLSEIIYSSTFFKGMFEKQQKTLNLPLIKEVYPLSNYRQANAEALLKLRNNLPLFLRLKQNGSVFILTTDISTTNGSFTSNALFPSILLRSAELSLRNIPLYFTIGKQGIVDLQTKNNQDNPITLNTKSNSFIPKQILTDGLVRIQLNQPELNERISEGFYTIKDDKILGKLAFNLNRKESEISLCSLDDLSKTFEEVGFDQVDVKTMRDGNSRFEIEIEKPTSFWRIFVIAALTFFLIEMAILKFWK